MSNEVRLSRRGLMQGGGAAGLMLGVSFSGARHVFAAGLADAATLAPNAFLKVTPDNVVTIISKHTEIGMGVTTGIATLVADEMDADWSQIRVEYAPPNDALYKNLAFGVQATGGQNSMAECFLQMREAGAVARAMLVSAAAQTWKVDEASVAVSRGVVRAGSHRATFGELAARASALPVPAKVQLKTPDKFVYIGKDGHRVDTRSKTIGTQIYTIDVRLPGMLTAVLARSPKFGGVVRSFDGTKALAVKGVKAVVQVPEGVAVIADGMWPAMKGREALVVQWDDSRAEQRSTSDLAAAYQAKLDVPGAVAKQSGDVAEGMRQAKSVFNADLEFPFLVHATMEPMNCVCLLRDGKLELWTSTQSPTIDAKAAATAAGIKPEDVVLHNHVAGGGFGRRGVANSDYCVEAVHIAMASKLEVPIRYQRTREDDTRSGWYRPYLMHRMQVGLDDKGEVCAWSHRIVGQSIMEAQTAWGNLVKNGVDFTSVEGASTMPYDFPNVRVDMHIEHAGPPVQLMRGVGPAHNVYAVETMIDQVAAASGKDPVAFRLAHMKDSERLAAVLRLAADKIDWGKALPPGHARGIAVGQYLSTPIVNAVELHREKNGDYKLDRVVAAIDCGRTINPDNVRSQMEGGVAFGLSSVLGQITLDHGDVVQGNFDSYQVSRLNQVPVIESYFVSGDEKPLSIGEAVVVTIGPAVANAIAALGGPRVRTLPFARSKVTLA